MRSSSLILAATVALAALCGCWPEGSSLNQAPALEPIPAPKPAPTTSPASGGGDVMALVNGKPVYMSKLNEVLLRGQGLELAEQLILTETVLQEAQKTNLSVNDAEVLSEHQQLLAEVFTTVPESEQRERALAQLLSEKGWSRVRWELICQRNALLRKMVEPNVAVTDEMVRAEYADAFGRKVVVRHIEVESLDEAEKVMKELRDKADFSELARKYSKNSSAKGGGLLPPLSRSAPANIDSAIRQVALNLKEVGEVSEPVKVGYAFHLLRVEKFIEPASAPFEQAQGKLREALREKLIRQGQQVKLMELMNASRFEFVNPSLREMRLKAATAANATP